MENNNSLPYGSIPLQDDHYNTLSSQSLYTPQQSTLATNNLQDPLVVARNLNPNASRSVPRDRSRPFTQDESVMNSWPGNERHNVPFTNQRLNGAAGISGVPTPSTRNDSHNSLINHQLINVPLLNSSESSNGTRTGNLFGVNRYFHAPWSVNGITYAERPNTNSYRPLDHSSGRPSPQLPTVTEQTPAHLTNYMNNSATQRGFVNQSSKKHSGIKRRVNQDDSEDGLPRPASKLLLTEEKMAAKMHNLSISNDHSYHMNGLPTQLRLMQPTCVSPSMTESDSDNGDEVKEDDNNNMESGNSSVFVLAPCIKEMLSKSTEVIPQSLLEQMSKPSLAIIPWKPPDEVLTNVSFNFNNNKTDDEKMAENDKNQNKDKDDSQCFTFGNSSVDHTEVIDDCETFEFGDDDDMDL